MVRNKIDYKNYLCLIWLKTRQTQTDVMTSFTFHSRPHAAVLQTKALRFYIYPDLNLAWQHNFDQ